MREIIRRKLRQLRDGFGAWAHDSEIAIYGSQTFVDGKLVASSPTVTHGELRRQREFNARYLPKDAQPPF